MKKENVKSNLKGNGFLPKNGGIISNNNEIKSAYSSNKNLKTSVYKNDSNRIISTSNRNVLNSVTNGKLKSSSNVKVLNSAFGNNSSNRNLLTSNYSSNYSSNYNTNPVQITSSNYFSSLNKKPILLSNIESSQVKPELTVCSRQIPQTTTTTLNPISTLVNNQSIFDKKPRVNMINLNDIPQVSTGYTSQGGYNQEKYPTKMTYISQNKYELKPHMKIINLGDLTNMRNTDDGSSRNLKESLNSTSTQKSSVVKTLNIFDLKELNQKEKKVLKMGKKLQKEKLIISHDGNVKKEENETTLMMKSMVVNKEEDIESEDGDITEEIDDEDESELKLEGEIKNEMQAKIEEILTQEEVEDYSKEDNNELNNEESKLEESTLKVSKLEESKLEESKLEESKIEENEIVEAVFDDYMKNYETNNSQQEIGIINEYKEMILKNYLDEKSRGDSSMISDRNTSFTEVQNKSMNKELLKKLEEFPSFLKDAEDKGMIDDLINKKKEEIVDKKENVKMDFKKKNTVEEIQTEEKPVIIMCEGTQEIEEPIVENVKLIEKVDEISNDPVPEEEKLEHKLIIVKSEKKEELVEENNDDDDNEGLTLSFNKKKQNINAQNIPNPMKEKIMIIEENNNGLEIVTECNNENEELSKTNQNTMEEFEEKVVNNEITLEKEKLLCSEVAENFNDYVQDAIDNGFADNLGKEKKLENPMADERNNNGTFTFEEIKNQMMIEAKIKPEVRIPEPIIEEKPVHRVSTGIKRKINTYQVDRSKVYEAEKNKIIIKEKKDNIQSDIEFSDAFNSDKEGESQPQTMNNSKIQTNVTINTNTVENLENEGYNDSYSRKRYGDKNDYTLSRTRLRESNNFSDTKNEYKNNFKSSIERSSIGLKSSLHQRNNSSYHRSIPDSRRTSRVVRRNGVEVNYNNSLRSSKIGGNYTKDIYNQFETVKEMKPIEIGWNSSTGKSRISLSKWKKNNNNITSNNYLSNQNLKNNNMKTSLQVSGIVEERKIETLRSILQSNLNGDFKNNNNNNNNNYNNNVSYRSTETRGRMSLVKTPIKGTPLKRNSKKKINLENYKSTNAEESRRASIRKKTKISGTDFRGGSDYKVTRTSGNRPSYINSKYNTANLSESKIERRRIEGETLKSSIKGCLLYTSPSPRDGLLSRMPSSA